MARTKNAKRIHEIAPFDPKNRKTVPADGAAWKKLAKYISTIEDETDEETTDDGYYDGDGTKEKTIISVRGGYSFEGIYDPEDEAQAMIAAMKYKIGDERLVWMRVTSSDGKKSFTQVGTVSDIKAGSGDATEYEKFSCKIEWIEAPIEKAIVK